MEYDGILLDLLMLCPLRIYRCICGDRQSEIEADGERVIREPAGEIVAFLRRVFGFLRGLAILNGLRGDLAAAVHVKGNRIILGRSRDLGPLCVDDRIAADRIVEREFGRIFFVRIPAVESEAGSCRIFRGFHGRIAQYYGLRFDFGTAFGIEVDDAGHRFRLDLRLDRKAGAVGLGDRAAVDLRAFRLGDRLGIIQRDRACGVKRLVLAAVRFHVAVQTDFNIAGRGPETGVRAFHSDQRDVGDHDIPVHRE